MKILAVDTSTRTGSIALLEDGIPVMEMTGLASLNQDEHLLAALDSLMGLAAWTLDDIEAFVVTRGPGSFTGIRVGLASVLGLQAATGKPALGISTLEAMAHGLAGTELPICTVLDAYKGEIYAAVYRRKDHELCVVMPPAVIRPRDLLSCLDGPVHFVGDGRAVLDSVLPDFPGVSPRYVPRYANIIRAGALGAWAEQRFAVLHHSGVPATDDALNSLEPLYLRVSDRELSFKAQTSPGAEGPQPDAFSGEGEKEGSIGPSQDERLSGVPRQA